jgi:hypothetical protein
MMFGHEARRIFGHNTVSMFIGTIPMGLATIINGCLALASPGSATASSGRMSCGGSMSRWRCLRRADPYFMFTRHEHSLTA